MPRTGMPRSNRGRSWRTNWQKTFRSRTRRAMSWPYCAPKSNTRTRSLSGACVVNGPPPSHAHELGQEPVELLLAAGDAAGADEALDLDLDVVAVLGQLDLPALAGDRHVD